MSSGGVGTPPGARPMSPSHPHAPAQHWTHRAWAPPVCVPDCHREGLLAAASMHEMQCRREAEQRERDLMRQAWPLSKGRGG